MSHLATELQLLLESRPGLSQREIAIETGISEPQISRYVSGTNEPAPEMLSRICEMLPAHDRGILAAAYLRDHLPACARGLVQIVIQVDDPPNESAERVRMDKRLREGFGHLERLAVQDADAAEGLLAAIRYLREDPTETSTAVAAAAVLSRSPPRRARAARPASTNTSLLSS